MIVHALDALDSLIGTPVQLFFFHSTNHVQALQCINGQELYLIFMTNIIMGINYGLVSTMPWLLNERQSKHKRQYFSYVKS